MEGMKDWRGNEADEKRHGGVRATLFLYLLVVVRSSINAANTNLVGFFRTWHNMTIARSVILSTNFGGATWILSILGGFVADSYIGRFKAIFFLGPFEILGYGILAFQAHHSSLHPPKCNIAQNPDADCESLQGWKNLFVYLGLFMVALGEGFMRASTPAFGSDQFDSNDPPQMKQKIRFFDFAAFATCFGATVGLMLVVWVQSFKGWNLGLGVCALFILSGLLVGVAGTPFYRYRLPGGSPLTRILQVIIVAFKKRKIVMPEKTMEDPEVPELAADADDSVTLSGTKDLRFLDKASVYTGETDAWSYCSISQVEEAKSFVKLLPILVSSVFCYFPFALFFTLTAPVASMMNTHLGGVRIAPAALYAVPVFIQWIVLVFYNRIITPLIGRCTSDRYSNVTTHLVRTGVGFVFALLATIVAALIERKRMTTTDPKTLSFLWMLPQFILVGLMEVTSFVGLMEFFSNQLPERIKPLSSSMVFCIVGLSVWLDGAIIAVVSKVTKIGDSVGWLDGMTFNDTRLDLFYSLLAVIEFVSLLNFAFWARKYLQGMRSQ